MESNQEYQKGVLRSLLAHVQRLSDQVTEVRSNQQVSDERIDTIARTVTSTQQIIIKNTPTTIAGSVTSGKDTNIQST